MQQAERCINSSGRMYGTNRSGRRLRHESVSWSVGQYQNVWPNYTVNDRNVYFGGRMIQSNSKTVLVDRTGSVRADETGATFEYLPYGEEFTLTAEDREKFATYTRSSVTGLDFAQQRWYDSVHGTFITPDRARRGISTGTPLSWNAYAYVQGDPINLNDPTGRFDDIPGDFCDLDPRDPSCMCLGDDLLDRDCLDEQGGDTGVPEGPGGAPYQAPPKGPVNPCASTPASDLYYSAAVKSHIINVHLGLWRNLPWNPTKSQYFFEGTKDSGAGLGDDSAV